MKLCWLIPDDRGGGIAPVALSCVRQARKAGHDAVLLILLASTGWLRVSQDEKIVSLGVDERDPDATRAILRWFGEHPQDVLVLNNCEQADRAIPYLPAGLGCIYAVHDTAPAYWRAALDHERDLDAIVAVSRYVADQFERRLRSSQALRMIHNGAAFPPQSDLPGCRADDVLFAGGDDPKKGAFEVLRLWPRLLEAGFAGTLHWAGSVKESFCSRVEALPQPQRIVLHGRVSHEAVFELASKAKVLLMLSRAEPFGMITVEAMGMGCVPVAWDIANGTREIVTCETGGFVPLGDHRALAACVVRLCAEHARFAAPVASRARPLFDERIMWQGYESLLREVTPRPPVRRSCDGQEAPDYVRATRRFGRLPAPLRRLVRWALGRSPRLGYWLRSWRGW